MKRHTINDLSRCFGSGDAFAMRYHDKEWGTSLRNDRAFFELLVLQGFQAGLAWRTVLYKREAFREAFHNFDVKRVARYTKADVKRLLADSGIIRNRLKIAAAIHNAGRFLEIQREFGSFEKYAKQFVYLRKPRKRTPTSWSDVPATTAESDAMSQDLKKRGFRFAGSTICYAFMQAAGMVNDHLAHCFRAQKRESSSR